MEQKDYYQNLNQDQIKYIEKWSWAGFFGNFIYTFGNKLYGWGVIILILIAGSWLMGPMGFEAASDKAVGNTNSYGGIFSLLGLANFAVAIMIGIKGRKMSWQTGKWKSFDEFRKRQRLLIYAIMAAWILLILFYGITLASSIKSISTPMDQLTAEQKVDKLMIAIKLQGREVKNETEFRKGALNGLADGENMKTTLSISAIELKNSDYALGYGSGYAVGCTEKQDSTVCENIYKEWVKKIVSEALDKL